MDVIVVLGLILEWERGDWCDECCIIIDWLLEKVKGNWP